MLWQGIILGEVQSKSNSRKLVSLPRKGGGMRPAFIKSAKALSWTEAAILQLRALRPPEPFDGELGIDCRIFYTSRRPDLDAELVFDSLQKAGVIKNDRSLREKHLFGDVDKLNPRVEIVLFRIKSETRVAG